MPNDNDKPRSRNPIARLFRFLWSAATFVYKAIVVVSLLAFLVVAWFAFSGGPPVVVEDNVALVIAPSGSLVDQLDDETGQIFVEQLFGEPPPKTLLRDLIEALESAAEDPRIPLAVLKLDEMTDASLPQLQELAEAVKKFRAAGKPVHAWGPYYDQSQYWLAAQGDSISLDPFGIVMMEGLSVYNNYFREALDKLGVQINVFRVGEYKSAVEPFERNDMSDEAREANRDWLGDLWASFVKSATAARKLPEQAVDEYIAGFAKGMASKRGDAAAYARDARLIDLVEPLQTFRARIGEKVGMDDEIGSFRQIYYRDYLRSVRETAAREGGSQSKVALIAVQGEIVDGTSEPGLAGGDTVAELLAEARRDEDVAAVVLRVDSPGGSVYASEQIRRAVQLLRSQGKPVVVSMGAVAASGGYWVSMDADEIWAHDSTVTGSIGIFGLVPTFDKPLRKLGIHTDGVGTTPLAGALRLDRPLTPEVSAIIQSQIEHGYRLFVEGVAQGREIAPEKVEEIARGRVWSGADALGLGLVDKLGGLPEAVAAAARLGGLQEGAYDLEEIKPEPFLPWKRWARLFGEDQNSIEALLREPLAQAQRALRVFGDPRGVYAHCFCVPDGHGSRP